MQFFWSKILGGTPKSELYEVPTEGCTILPDGQLLMVSKGNARRLVPNEIKDIIRGRLKVKQASKVASQG